MCYIYRMVLLCNDSNFDIKKTHIIKSLDKKRDNFKVVVVPLKEEANIIINNNITDSEINKIFEKK